MNSNQPEQPGGFEQYASPAPLYIDPSYIRETRERIESGVVRGVAHAVSERFRRAAITIHIDGDDTAWSRPGQGALFIGDHHHGLESVAVVAALGERKREDWHFIGKPFAMQARVAGALGVKGAAALLPVIPGSLARGQRPKLDRNLLWRTVLHNRPDLETVQAINARTLEACASLIRAGHAIAVYPAGGVMDATKRPWRPGVGRIIKQLPPETRDTATVVPFQARRFPGLRIVRSLLLSHYGMTPEPLTATIRLGQQGTVTELLGDTSDMDAEAVTNELQQQYTAYFRPRTA